jgi:hypothetical protein
MYVSWGWAGLLSESEPGSLSTGRPGRPAVEDPFKLPGLVNLQKTMENHEIYNDSMEFYSGSMGY